MLRSEAPGGVFFLGRPEEEASAEGSGAELTDRKSGDKVTDEQNGAQLSSETPARSARYKSGHKKIHSRAHHITSAQGPGPSARATFGELGNTPVHNPMSGMKSAKGLTGHVSP